MKKKKTPRNQKGKLKDIKKLPLDKKKQKKDSSRNRSKDKGDKSSRKNTSRKRGKKGKKVVDKRKGKRRKKKQKFQRNKDAELVFEREVYETPKQLANIKVDEVQEILQSKYESITH